MINHFRYIQGNRHGGTKELKTLNQQLGCVAAWIIVVSLAKLYCFGIVEQFWIMLLVIMCVHCTMMYIYIAFYCQETVYYIYCTNILLLFLFNVPDTKYIFSGHTAILYTFFIYTIFLRKFSTIYTFSCYHNNNKKLIYTSIPTILPCNTWADL